MKKIYLTESQLNNLITERMSSKVYHYTSIYNVLKISEEDTIYLQSALGGTANNTNNGKLFYLSTTRTKYQGFGYSSKFTNNSARIELDGDKLNNDFSGKPYSYWSPEMGKYGYLKSNLGLTKDKQEHIRDEAEDRLFSNKSSIEPAHKYIKRIDIIMTDINDKTDENYLNISNLLIGRYRSLVFVYDNLNDFNKQSNNTINKIITDDYSTYRKGVYDYDNVKSNDDLINLVLAAILKGESNNPIQDSAKLLKQYGLDKYLKNGLLKNNKYMNYVSINNIAEMLSYKIDDASRKPNREKSKILQMLTDYFNKNKIKNYSDFIKFKTKLL